MGKLAAERLCLLGGSILLLLAVCLYVSARLEDIRAGEEAASTVEMLRQSRDAASAAESGPLKTEELPAESAVPEAEAEAQEESDTTEARVDRDYLGVLTIPALGLELPVQTEWSKENLQVSPCRQCGSVEGGDLVIAAHNYKSHFGRLSSLTEGDEVRFTSQDGAEAVYTVERLAQLSPREPEVIREGGCPLVLYTCTPGGKARVVVYCRRQK